MAEHERYRRLNLAKCRCSGWLLPYAVSYEAEQVTYECAECGDVAGVFYRAPELEQEGARADKAMIGRIIKAGRCVAWVGYAKNPSTVPISEDDLWEKAKELCANWVNEATFGTHLAKFVPAGVVTCEQTEGWLDKANWRVRRAFEQWARYELRGEAYRTDPLRNRGFWFQDVPVEGEVMATVACVTGRQIPGHGGGRWDDYCAPYLSSPVRHTRCTAL